MRAVLFALCCLCLSAGSIRAAGSPPDFSGDWMASDKADEATTAAKPSDDNSGHSRRGREGGMGGGGHGFGGGRGGHRNHAASDDSGTSAAAGASTSIMPREHAGALIIRPSDDVFDIEANGRRMAYRYDGKHNYGPQYGGTVSVTWAAPELVIETHADAGGSFEEHYRLSADGKKLTLLLRAQPVAGGSVQETRRVYVRREDVQ